MGLAASLLASPERADVGLLQLDVILQLLSLALSLPAQHTDSSSGSNSGSRAVVAALVPCADRCLTPRGLQQLQTTLRPLMLLLMGRLLMGRVMRTVVTQAKSQTMSFILPISTAASSKLHFDCNLIR